MEANARVVTFREAAGELLEDMPKADEARLERRLGTLSASQFDDLCVSFRKAEVLEGMMGYLRRMFVNLACGGILLWSAERLSARWIVVLMIVGAALILTSICLDVLSYMRLERRCEQGLGLKVRDVIFQGREPMSAVEEFCRSLGTPDSVA